MTPTERHFLALVLPLLLGWLTACAGSMPTAADLDAARAKVEAVAKQSEAAKAQAIKVSHEALDAIEVARKSTIIAGLLSPEEADWTAMALTRARDVLDRVERGDKVAKDEIRAVLGDVDTAVKIVRKYGGNVGPLVDSAMALVTAVVAAE